MMIEGEIWEDNMGCILLTTNQQTSNRTKHVDSKRHHLVRYLLHYSLQVVRFVWSEDNASNVCTKIVMEAIRTQFSPMIKNGLIGKFVTKLLEMIEL
jgi:hypothetical protein